jgi:hypothetical protein
MDTNAFTTSLQQLGQWLAQQNQGTGSGSPAFGASNAGGYNSQQPSKVVTQVHYDQTPPPTETSRDLGTPAVATAPPAPQVSSFAPPQGSASAIPQPGGVTVGDYSSLPKQTASQAQSAMGVGGAGGAGGMGGAGSGVPTSNAIAGVTSALSKGFSDAGQAIANVKTMPTPIDSGPFPGINQQTPILFGRR